MNFSEVKIGFSGNIKPEDCKPEEEANNLLENGILVETSSGLVCMSLTDALSSDLNLSVEELKNVAAQLISQQNTIIPNKPNDRIHLTSCNFDSDGFSSECSDISSNSAPFIQPAYFTLTSLASETKMTFANKCEKPDLNLETQKIISFVPVTVDPKSFIHEEISIVPTHSSSELSATSNVSDSDTSIATSFSNPSDISSNKLKTCVTLNSSSNSEPKSIIDVSKPLKRRGGWPKGRKRKPELLNLPPKAPATGYNLYLNEQRKLFKDSTLAFHEITKVIGNRWSSLSLEEKKPYLEKAEEDKKRYREELNKYRQSDAYRAYLNKKRKNRLQNNILSESDMDATDDVDDEDNEELYCRTCDQWFHNLHNKREHLQGRQHTQSVAGDIRKQLGSLDGNSEGSSKSNGGETKSVLGQNPKGDVESVSDSINILLSKVATREKEIKSLKCRLEEAQLSQTALFQQLCSLTERQMKLKTDLASLKESEKIMENNVFQLWKVPSLFIITDFNTEIVNDFTGES